MTSILDIDYLYDSLFIEQLYNKTLPAWTQKVFPDAMKPLKDLSFKLNTWTPEMKRLRSGPLIQSILDHFRHFVEGKTSRKMLMYSGHDTTVSSLLNSLGMFDPPLAPPYASMVIIELLKSDSKYWLQFAFRNETTHEPYELRLFDCPKECPLDSFDSLTKHLRPENWAQECELQLDLTAEAVTYFSICITAFIALILCIAVIFACAKKLFYRKSKATTKDYKYLDY